MKRKLAIALLLLCISLPLPSYTDQMEQQERVTSIAIEWGPTFGLLSEMKQTAYILDIDKEKLTVREKIANTDEWILEKEHLVTSELVSKILQTMQLYDFFTLPLYIDTGVMDGDITMITVITANHEYTVSGLNANEYGPETFREIWRTMMLICSETFG